MLCACPFLKLKPFCIAQCVVENHSFDVEEEAKRVGSDVSKKEPVLQSVEKITKKAKGVVTAADVSAVSGLPLRDVETALERMIELYRVSVSADTDTGAVKYTFKYPFIARGSKTWGERWQSIKATLWKGFKVTYKALTGVILAGYTVIFAAILIGLAVAGGGDNDDDNFNPAHVLGMMFRLIWEAVFWHTMLHPIEYDVDSSGMRYRRFKQKEKKKSFITSVFDFVFGPEVPGPDADEDAREVAAFARKHQAEITPGHVVALSGVTYSEAEERLADYLVRFKADAHVREDGVVVADMHTLTQRAGAVEEAPIIMYPDEVDPPVVHNGNTGGKNAMIIAMNIFNLGFSFFILAASFNTGEFTDVQIGGGALTALQIALGYFPLAFSVLFFAIPLGRYIKLPRKKKKRERSIIRKKMMRLILENADRPLTRNELLSVANRTPEAEPVLDALAIELQADTELDSNGEMLYIFERLRREL